MATSAQTVAGQPSAAQIASTAPLPVQDFGDIAQVNPTYDQAASALNPALASAATTGPAATYGASTTGTPLASAATVDPNQSQAYMQQAYAQNAAALAPTFAQQQSQLQDADAARGISNSGAASYLQGNLQGQQASALASADEPITSQGYGYSQSDLAANQAAQNTVNLANQSATLNTGEFNAANTQSANAANAAAQNQFAEYNAGNQQQTNLANQNSINATGQFNAGNQQQANLVNAAASNAATGTNAQYYTNAVNTNAADYNSYLSALYGSGSGEANSLLSAYLNSFGPNTGVESAINTQEGATANTYNSVYGQAAQGSSNALGLFGSAAGSLFGSGNAAAPTDSFDYAEAATSGGG